jgi:hypothetical protein
MDVPKNSDLPEKRRRNTYKQPKLRTMFSIQPGLLKLVDEAAEKDFTTRSEIVRIALLWYLRPQGRDLATVDPDEIYKILRRREGLRGMRALMRNTEISHLE